MSKKSFLLASALLTLSLSSWANSPAGKWKTIDDETGRPKSIVEITESGGKLTGKVIELFRKPEEDQNPICDRCEGEKKNQPVKGLTILWDLKAEGNEWKGGHILDPKNGKIYKCKMKLIENGNKLEVRGFIGFSLLGRTQVWEKQN